MVSLTVTFDRGLAEKLADLKPLQQDTSSHLLEPFKNCCLRADGVPAGPRAEDRPGDWEKWQPAGTVMGFCL